MSAYTFGLEEEFFVVQRPGGELARALPAQFLSRCRDRLGPRVGLELLQSQIEAQTVPYSDSSDALAELKELRAGLVARVVPDDQVVAQAMAAAHTIAGYSRPATRLAREAVMRAEELSLAEGVAWERGMFQRLFGTPDQREGMQAFVEKRKPRFHPD